MAAYILDTNRRKALVRAGQGSMENRGGLRCSRLGRRDEAREHLEKAARLFDAGPGATEDERARVRKGLEALDRAPGR